MLEGGLTSLMSARSLVIGDGFSHFTRRWNTLTLNSLPNFRSSSMWDLCWTDGAGGREKSFENFKQQHKLGKKLTSSVKPAPNLNTFTRLAFLCCARALAGAFLCSCTEDLIHCENGTIIQLVAEFLIPSWCILLRASCFNFRFKIVLWTQTLGETVPSTGKRGAGPDVFWAGSETEDVSK